MKKPYINAFILPFFLSPAALCFKKKLTVIGIIGKTQGVKVTKIPAKSVPKNNNQRLISSDFSSVTSGATSSSEVVEAVSIVSVVCIATVSTAFSIVCGKTTSAVALSVLVIATFSATLIAGNLKVIEILTYYNKFGKAKFIGELNAGG